MSNLNRFEAAALYDFNSENYNTDLYYVVLDSDNSSLCLVSVSADGKVESISSFNSENNSFVIDSRLTGAIGDLWYENLDIINVKVEKYIRSMMNEEMSDMAFRVETSDVYWDAKYIVDRFTAVVSRYIDMLDELDALIINKNILDDKLRFIVIGKNSRFYMFMYVLKNKFTFDPFMADNRFSQNDYSDMDLIISEVNALVETKRTHKVVYKYLEDGKTVEKVFPFEDVGNSAMVNEIFIIEGEKLSFIIDEKEEQIGIPRDFFDHTKEWMIVDVGLERSENELNLVLFESGNKDKKTIIKRF